MQSQRVPKKTCLINTTIEKSVVLKNESNFFYDWQRPRKQHIPALQTDEKKITKASSRDCTPFTEILR